jgi:hypothetical protein
MSEQPEQLTSVDGMSPEEIVRAQRQGKLDALLGGDPFGVEADVLAAHEQAPAPEAEQEPEPPATIDQGARGGPSPTKRDAAWLANASAEEIARATRRGELKDLLGG